MLASADDLTAFGYDAKTVAPKLYLASVSVQGHLAGRASAAAALVTPTLPLRKIVCDVAARLAATPAQVAQGVRVEQSGSESVTWGAEAYNGAADLTDSEMCKLDQRFPFSVRTAEL